MSRVIHRGVPVFVPLALTLDQATATFAAVRAAFMVYRSADLAQAMHTLAEAIDKRRAELTADDDSGDS